MLPLPVESGAFVEINGTLQWVTLRGRSPGNPALLMIGGAGAALSRMAPFYAPWERHFTLIQWDQPGAGATQALNGAPDPFTLERLADDGIAVAEHARRRLGVERLVLLGISGGSILGLKMVKARPDLFAAYAGNGQFVHWARQAALSYRMLLVDARAAGDRAAVAELERIGPPPYTEIASDVVKAGYANAFTPAEQAALAGLDPAVLEAIRTPPADATWVAPGLPDQDPIALATIAFERLRPALESFDARALGLDFAVPMLFFQGERDRYAVTSEVEAYAVALRAPVVKVVLLRDGGHMSSFMRDDLLALLNRHVWPLAAAA